MGLVALADALPVAVFDDAVNHLCRQGTVVLSGLGKSGHVARKISSTMTSLGTRSVYIHPTEAAHGDLGFLGPQDALLALSRSGGAEELLHLFHRAKDLNIPSVLITEDPASRLARVADFVLPIPKVLEAWGHAPSTSTTMQMGLGDALAICLAQLRGFTNTDFKRTHPGGALGHLKKAG